MSEPKVVPIESRAILHTKLEAMKIGADHLLRKMTDSDKRWIQAGVTPMWVDTAIAKMSGGDWKDAFFMTSRLITQIRIELAILPMVDCDEKGVCHA